jgi:hypothetical protein
MLFAKGVNGVRLDCVRLKNELCTSNGTVICARVIAIVMPDTPSELEPLCLCVPLFKTDPTSIAPLDEIQTLVVEYFPLVRVDCSRLFVIRAVDIECHEQIQFISGLQYKYGLVNVFCQSKIAQSALLKTAIQIDPDTSDVQAEERDDVP